VALSVPDDHDTAWFFVREGTVRCGAVTVRAGQVAVLPEGPLELEAEAPCEWYAGSGRSLDEPWAKLLGHNGFVLADDEAGCAALHGAYAEDPSGFGRH
jgi:hypothetical protein